MREEPGPDPQWLVILTGRVPDIVGIRDEHVAYYHEVIPHVLMGEIARWVQQMWVGGNRDVVRSVVAALESQYDSMSAEDRNVVDVSFVELLPLPSEPGAEISGLLGPKLSPGYRAVNHLPGPDQ